MKLNTIIGMSFLGLTLSFVAHAAEQPEDFPPFDKASMKEEANLPSSNLYLHITEIAKKNGTQPDDLEGGYVLMFNADNHLANHEEACALSMISQAMNKGSLDAHLMMGLTMEAHGKNLTQFVLQHYLAAASGDDGTGHQGNGGTSSGLAFYNIRRVHQLLVNNQKLKQSMSKNIMDDLNKLYQKNARPSLKEESYRKQIEDIQKILGNKIS